MTRSIPSILTLIVGLWMPLTLHAFLPPSTLMPTSPSPLFASSSSPHEHTRRHTLLHSPLLPLPFLLSSPSSPANAQDTTTTTNNNNKDTQTVYTTNSGLKYIDLRIGTGPTPQYGNLVSISYTASLKLPSESQPSTYDSDTAFLLKHGNGRCIPGLDEGLHTLKQGGQRRLILPPKLGYITSGLGPLPRTPWDRWRLNRLLERMVEEGSGQLILDVELKTILEDEADQGYYTDQSLSVEDFDRLRDNIQQAGKEARETKMQERMRNEV